MLTAGTTHREDVLKSLQNIADAFVRKVAERTYKENQAIHKSARGRVFTYGSYRLGVFGPGSDIDTLVVGPKYVTREHFFELFPGLLREMTPPGAITDMTSVTDAFVPIIKFEYSGISIDLIFSRIVTLMEIPPQSSGWNLLDNNLLRGLDEAELRSLNGTRVTDDILKLVPEQTSFRLALRAIKLWAQKRAIYANIMGFPGGVAWAMLVARVCQLYPKANGAVIVNKFFHIIRRWPWPQPVLLKQPEDGPLQVRVWNPKLYKGDGYHLMPIITPAYPSMCATFNITHSSKAIIQKELDHFANQVDQVMLGKVPWKSLFVKHTFFTQDYKYYIIVNAASTTKENSKIWGGFVESKIRLLVQSLERHPSIQLARPFNKGYERKHRYPREQEEWTKILDGSLEHVVKDEDTADEVKTEPGNGTVKAEPALATGIKDEDGLEADVKDVDVKMEGGDAFTQVYTSTHYIGLELREGESHCPPPPPTIRAPLPPFQSSKPCGGDKTETTCTLPYPTLCTILNASTIDYTGAKQLDLSYEVNDFKNLCFAWDKYDKELQDSCALSIQHVRK